MVRVSDLACGQYTCDPAACISVIPSLTNGTIDSVIPSLTDGTIDSVIPSVTNGTIDSVAPLKALAMVNVSKGNPIHSVDTTA
jgi:hypothetical protein